MKNCTYVYKGKSFSQERLMRALVNELPSRSQAASIEFLKEYLGMTESEIVVVNGLISNKSLGRYKADGKILLSDLATADVAYHEAFHRVWRMYLSPEERLNAIKEIKNRKSYQTILNSYKAIYPKLSDNELIEEFLADEFADYTLNKDYKIETPIKSLFERLVNFLKKLLGLKPQQTQMIYDKILAKTFKNAPKSVSQYFKDADKVLINGVEFTVEEKNEIGGVLTQQFINAVLKKNGDIDAFLNNSSTKVKDLLRDYVLPTIGNQIMDVKPDLAEAFFEDTDAFVNDPLAKFESSIFINNMVRDLKLVGLTLKDDMEDLSEGALEEADIAAREFAPSIEMDPKSKMGGKIKLMLSSLADNTHSTSNFGFPKPIGWTKSFVQIAMKMAGIPTSVFMDELKKSNLPYAESLVSMLDQDSIFRNKFISTLAMTENTFYKMMYKDGDIYFFDANSGTRESKILGEWSNNLLRKIENWEEWKAEVSDVMLKITKTADDELMDLLGIDLNPGIEARSILLSIMDRVSKYNGDKPDSRNIYKELDIKNLINNLVHEQARFEDALDLMVNLGGKKLYTLGLNTQQTTVINSIKYAQSLFTEEMTQTEKIEILKQFAEFQVSEFNVTKLSDGTYKINNKWLERILNGERLELVIPYLTETEAGDKIEIAKLDEADLMTMHLNASLQGLNMSMKHGDRSTFFAYTFGNKPLYDVSSARTETEYLDILVDNIKEQIELEIKLAKNLERLDLPVQYIGKKSDGAFTKAIFGDEVFEKLLEGEPINTTKIYDEVSKYYQQYKSDVKEYGLLDTYDNPKYDEKGDKKGVVKTLKGVNRTIASKYTSTDLVLAAAFVNEFSNHMFEMRFFSGDVKAFKNGADLFKRMNPQSSTGNLSVNSVEAQMDVKQRLNQDWDIINPVTGEALSINPANFIEAGKEKYFRAVTAAERETYESHLIQPATTPSGLPIISKLTGKQESKLFMLFEYNFIQDFPNYSLDELQTLYKPKFELYEEKYKGANENDGQSYMTLPAFKNFMIRQGNWTDGMEVIYQIEMKIASLKSKEDIANMEVTVKGVTFKPFEINSQKEVNGRKIDGWKNRIVNGKLIKTDAAHTLKTQFGGYSVPEKYFDDVHGDLEYLFNSVFKTSQHILIPSSIMGTNLQLMNYSMLSNGIDIVHMGSANKVGGVDPKLAAQKITSDPNDTRNSREHINDIAERGLDFYDKDGYFNHKALNENKDILTYLSNWDFLKDQVKIGNKVKSEIKGSTQSLKIVLSNLVVNGKSRFNGASDLIKSYKEVIEEMVHTNHDNLLSRIGYNLDTNEFDSLDKLKETILGSSQIQSAPDNIRNAIQNFFEDPSVGIESVPMKNKIENVLYSLITNGIISFDRPGSSYPQAAVTGYEALGSRKFDGDIQTSNQDTLKFYDPMFDEEGNLIKINPAEVIMPLPDYWIKPLLRWAKTNNLVKAIDMLNEDISKRSELYQFKGLRIPNQQLSSNDIFQVKKFNLPTVQNYIVIPTEMVVKTGGDFDIDKLNIYWAEDTQNKIFGSLTDEELEDQYSNDEDVQEAMSFEEYKNSYNTSVDRILLNYEKDIILHPRNAHQLLMPLTDEIFVKDIYNDLLKRGVIKAVNSSYFGSMLPSTNVKNTTIFVKGKYGVGPVALAITNAATNQADGLSLNQAYSNQEGIVTPTKLLFDGMGEEYSLDNYTDNKGTVISEILSQLLTTQVDNVKNPTAVLMNINMQTLGVMLYLIRRKINPRTIVLFLQQPIIAKYLQYQRSNESLFNKQADAKSRAKGNKANELSKKWLIKKLLKDLGYGEDMELPDPYTTVASTKVLSSGLKSYNTEEGLVVDDSEVEWEYEDVNWSINDSKMLTSAVEQKFDKEQLLYLSYFMELQSQSRAFSDFQQTQNSDTKGLKDRQMLDESREIVARTFLSQIVDPNDIGRLNFSGVISPFYKYGRLKYSIFNNFYGLSNSVFGGLLLDLKSKAASTLKGDAKDKVRQTIENDFMLFLVHRFMTNKDEFNRLMKGGSVAKRVMDLKTKLPSNLVLQAFFPMINNSLDKSLSKPEKMDNLRLFEKELNDLDNNDMKDSLEEIQEFDPKLYEDIVKLLMFQTGLNISPFNYRSIVPVGLNKNRNEFNEFEYLYQDLLQNAIKEMKKQVRNGKDAKMIFKSFITLFAANNVNFLAKNTNNSNYPFPLIKIWDRESSSWKLKSASNQEQPILGDAYHKQYFESLINPRLESKNKEESKNVLNEVFEDHEDVPVTVDAVPNKYELFPGVYANKGQQEALDLLEEFLKSNEKEFTLIGRGGTGKTTIIKKVLSQLNGKSVMGMTVAHKAKKVLGRSIGRDKVKTFASATANKMNETTGKFEPDMYARQQGRVPISSVDVLIVDEASMISPKMRDEINSLIRQGTKVIYMGDNAQLPPVGESEDSPVFNLKNQYTLKEKMRQAKTSPIIDVGSVVADNIEGETKLVAIKDRVSKFDEESKSETVFVSDDNVAIDMMITDIKNAKMNPDFVKAVTFNNENHNASQSVKNLNIKIRAKLWGDKASNQLNVGEMLTAYDSYAKVPKPTEDDMIIHNSEDFVVKAFTETSVKNTVKVASREKGERSFTYNYNVLDVELIDDEGKPIKGNSVTMIANSSKAQYEADMARLWKEDSQLAIALKGQFANLQYGYAITSHKAQGSTYTNTYVFEDNILGPTNGGDTITKNKSLYVAVSRPTTKLVMISDRNGSSETPVIQPKVEKPKTINIYSTDKNGYEKLSNLADRKFKDKQGREYFSVEHAYQSWKSGKFDEETYKKYSKGGVKIAGNKGTKTESNWNLNLMKGLIKQSLEQNPDIMDLLVGTGSIPLTHTQDKGKWGTEFPKLLMEVRDELRPKTVENLEDYQVVWSSEDTPKSSNPPSSSDEFFPTEFRSQINLGVDSINSAKTESFEKEIGIRNSDGTRKKMKESDYETALRKVKRLNSKYPSMFELIKTTGEKGDSRVYYSIKLSPYGLREVNLGYKPDLNMRDKYFENGSKTDVKTILKKISESDSNLATVAKQLLEYASINNVSIELVKEIEDPAFSDNDISVTNGIFYNKRSPIHSNTILISEFANFTNGKAEGVIIHEILHALTYEELFHKNKDAAKDFEKLFEYVKANSPKGMYALTNLDEFMTGIFTNARFIQHLKTLPPTKSIKEYKNLFEEILDLFRKLFNLQDDSALTQAMSIASHVLMDVRTEKDYKDSFESLQEFDKSKSQYSPSLKLYEGFINLNQLYQGDEILPFLGESEYYRYLVPMLLKMNPGVKTMFTQDLKYQARQIAEDLGVSSKEYVEKLDSYVIDGRTVGMSNDLINTNLIRPTTNTKTLVHELIHRTLQKEYEKKGDFKQKIDDLFIYAWDRQQSDGTYGFSSPKEFLAEALSNPDFMEELNNIQYKEETVWSYLMTLVSDFINNLLNIELRSDSVLAEVVRVSEQVLNNNISEIGKETKVDSTTMANEIYNNWSIYFPDYEWMNDAQRRMTAKLAEEGKITLTCSL